MSHGKAPGNENGGVGRKQNFNSSLSWKATSRLGRGWIAETGDDTYSGHHLTYSNALDHLQAAQDGKVAYFEATRRVAFIAHQAVLGLWEFQLDGDNTQWHG